MKDNRFFRWLAWHLPHHVVRWCVIRVWSEVTVESFRDRGAMTITIDEALRAWK